MKPNVGKCDRYVRGFAGVALLALAALLANLWSILLAVAGICLVLSAAFGICFLYRALGINSCPIEPPSKG